ncbi:MAG TPA: BamA/TamA family outer membrane protein [Gemmatimonadales bacterium]|nr:BamA/TamA family outer membrane protein [Gemmatimonadales bacterium]
MPTRQAPAVRLLLALALVATLPGTASAQYFGRNKVQYESLDFKVLRTPHFDIYFYERERDAAAIAARDAERWYDRLSTIFDHKLRGRQPVILYGTSSTFQQTNAIQGEIGEGTGGVTEPLRRRVVLPIGGPLRDLDHVLGHELVHAFQFDITGAGPTGATGGIPTATALPLWFIEGMAEYFSLGPVDPLTAMWMRDAAQHRMPNYAQLEDPNFFPYRYGQALLAYVGGRWGDTTVAALLRVAGARGDVGVAIRQVLGMEPDTLVSRWHEATHEAYDPLLRVTVAPAQTGRAIVGPEGEAAQYNVSPALSPDGKRLMFLSNRGLFSVDLYLADAATGKIIRKVTSTAVNPHFQSLQFIMSAGAWSPDGRKFVFAGVSAGQPLLSIYDVEHDRTEREIKFSDLGEIYNPTWSPDGRSIAFSAVVGGLTDLYVYPLHAKAPRRLTHDAFADLMPSWSPDGRSIAFVTDRFTTNVDSLTIGNYQLALIDPTSGEVRRIGPNDGAKQINPQWAPDSRSLYYISDPDGIANLYRLDMAAGTSTRLTNLYTGASGITVTSPALSVASGSGAVAYSGFNDNAFTIFALDTTANPAPIAVAERREAAAAADSAARENGEPSKAAGALVAPYVAAPLPVGGPALLPPEHREGQIVATLLHQPLEGLPPDTSYAVHPYHPSLGLEYVGQPSLAVGSDAFGTFVGGGAALYFSDILGNHNLVVGAQISGSINDLSGLVAYQNLSHRFNWGISLQEVPFRTGAFFAGPAVIDGDTVFAQQELLNRQINTDANFIVQYPFSPQQRVEFGVGYSNIRFTSELRTQGFSFITGEQVIDDKQDLPHPNALNLGTASAALVYDNSIFGAVGPILGQRYRLEVDPEIGSLTLFNVLADYRKYVQPVTKLTIAARLLHYGRYGSDGDDPRLTPLFLGYEGLVRGYTLGSFNASECQPTAADPNACPVFDRLVGSRIAVANLELRFPLLGIFSSSYYGGFPLEFAFFGDGGVAWTGSESPTITGGTRKPVFSTGAALRANIFGYLVAQVDLVHPFDRPGKNFVWEFSLLPAF